MEPSANGFQRYMALTGAMLLAATVAAAPAFADDTPARFEQPARPAMVDLERPLTMERPGVVWVWALVERAAAFLTAPASPLGPARPVIDRQSPVPVLEDTTAGVILEDGAPF